MHHGEIGIQNGAAGIVRVTIREIRRFGEDPRQKPFVEGQYLIPLITARVSKGHGSDISSEERALTVPRSVVGPVLANRDLLLFPDCLLIVPICHYWPGGSTSELATRPLHSQCQYWPRLASTR